MGVGGRQGGLGPGTKSCGYQLGEHPGLWARVPSLAPRAGGSLRAVGAEKWGSRETCRGGLGTLLRAVTSLPTKGASRRSPGLMRAGPPPCQGLSGNCGRDSHPQRPGATSLCLLLAIVTCSGACTRKFQRPQCPQKKERGWHRKVSALDRSTQLRGTQYLMALFCRKQASFLNSPFMS